LYSEVNVLDNVRTDAGFAIATGTAGFDEPDSAVALRLTVRLIWF